MIGGIYSGTGINVTNGTSTPFPYVANNPNNPMQGMLRLNGNTLQVFDGTTWVSEYTSQTQISLDSETRELLEWARKQREHESKLESLMQHHPGLRDLHDRFEIFRALCQEETS